MAGWVAAASEAFLAVAAFVGLWVRVNTRLTALETRLGAAEGVLHRIEDAIWAQAGIAALGQQDRPKRA